MLHHRPHSRRSRLAGLALAGVLAVAGIVPVGAQDSSTADSTGPAPETPVTPVAAEPAPPVVQPEVEVVEVAPEPVERHTEPEPKAVAPKVSPEKPRKPVNKTARSTKAKAGGAADVTKPEVQELKVTDVTRTTAVVDWTTDEKTKATIRYGMAKPLQRDVKWRGSPTREHKHTLRDLKPGRRYIVRVLATDKSGNSTTSREITFRTDSKSTASSKATLKKRDTTPAAPRAVAVVPEVLTLEVEPDATPVATPALADEPLSESIEPVIPVEPTPIPLLSPSAEPVSEPSVEPVVTPGPSVEPSVEPEPTTAPEPSAEPEISPEPGTSPSPDASPMPVESPLPEATALPEESPLPDASPLPEASALPDESPLPVEPPLPEGPAIRSDQEGYTPGSLVVLTGTAWQPNEPIDLLVNDAEGDSWSLSEMIAADELGTFTFEFPLPDWHVAVYTIVATGELSGEAVWNFTDAAGTGDATEAMPEGPSIRSDKEDYAPGSLVALSGIAWQPNETVDLLVNDDEGKSWSLSESVVADEVGTFTFDFRLPAWFVATYTVVATGELSGEAVWSFTDAAGTGASTDGDNGSSGSTEITVATPITSAGDILLANIAVWKLRNRVLCAPNGWTSLGTTRNGGLSMGSFYRVAGGGEAASYTWQFRTSAADCGTNSGKVMLGSTGAIVSYSGIDTSSPIRVVSTNTGRSNTPTAPSALGAQANDTVVRHFSQQTGNPMTTSGTSSTGVPYAQVYSTNRNGTLSPSIAAADADQSSSGSTGTLTASGVNRRWVAHTIVLAYDAPTITLTIPDGSADFGTNLAPDGRASNSADTIGVQTDTAGACYTWAGSIEVESTVDYRVEVAGSTAKPRLRFHDTIPADYAECASGEQVRPGMFASASPSGTWIDAQTATSGRTHSLVLGLDARWMDAPDPNLGAATITFTAVAG